MEDLVLDFYATVVTSDNGTYEMQLTVRSLQLTFSPYLIAAFFAT